jgi:hypothetical protein
MKKTIGMILSSLFVLILTGCGLLGPSAQTPTIAPTITTAVFPTEAVIETEIPLPTAIPPTATPSPTATPAQIAMISATIDMDNYSLRSGPGRLFERIDTYSTGTVVSLFGREFTNNWVLVKTEDNTAGWMNVIGLKSFGDINSLPLFKVDNAQILQGHVYLPGKIPASGVVIALDPVGSESSANTHQEGESDQSGVWAIYIPQDTTGEWQVGPSGVTCANSNAVTPTADGCEIIGNLPPSQEITLPFTPDLSLEFEMLPANP